MTSRTFGMTNIIFGMTKKENFWLDKEMYSTCKNVFKNIISINN